MASNHNYNKGRSHRKHNNRGYNNRRDQETLDRHFNESLPPTIPPTNMVPNMGTNDCNCDPEFVSFCKMHCVSHLECGQSRKLKCHLCSVVADVKSIQSHLSSDKHRDKHQRLMEYLFLMSIPYPSESHCNKLSDLLNANFDRIAINSFNFIRREEVVDKINVLLRRNGLNQFMVRLYGSSINGFGLKNSDINMDLVMSPSEAKDQNLEPQQQYELVAITLSKVSDTIVKSGKSHDLTNVRNDYNLKVPKVHFTDCKNRLECELSITAEKNWRLSKLLSQYAMIDPRARILGVALREWARIYGFDDQENGLWPAFAFPILIIHFLQRCVPPVLPCLHELFPRNNSTSDGTQTQTQTHQNSVASSRTPFEDNEALEEEFDLKLLDSSKWVQQNNKSVGQLWLEMLHYYTIEFDTETFVVSIRNTHSPQTHRQKNWTTRVLAIEDPCRPSLNLSRSVGSMRLYNVFIKQLQMTYKYFATPYINTIPTNSYSNIRNSKPLFTERDFDILVDQTEYYNKLNVNDLITQMNYVLMELNDDSDNKQKKNSDDSESDEDNKLKEDNFHIKVRRLLKTFGIRMVLRHEIESSIHYIRKEQIVHSFQLNRMPFFQRPQKYCRLCRRYGHQQRTCPDEQLPDLVRLPDIMDSEHKDILNDICLKLFFMYRMDERDEELHNIVMTDLENFIQKKMPKAKLELFGSTKNGFGARRCDLDICLTFVNNQTGEGLEYAEIIENVGQLLKYHNCVRNITPITSAKVPIVKFFYIYNQMAIECDISLYNILARFNTLLLKTYCQIDDRVQILGFIVKHFAKTCDICDASRGSLSSYAYILMTIHYFQQKGIIPVLQQIGLDHKQDRIVDGWDTWFFDDLHNLSKYWQPKQPNRESIAELFLGFLRYYTEVFNFDEDVVCCRQLAPLKRLEKLWTGRKIAIEDPFLLSHNLGAGVDNQMAAFIKTSIAKGRNIIGCPPYELPQKYRNWIDYFFDKSLLTQGLPPTGRGCRNCGKIGHKQNMCPERVANRRNIR